MAKSNETLKPQFLTYKMGAIMFSRLAVRDTLKVLWECVLLLFMGYYQGAVTIAC